MKVLVTGATGYIGHQLALKLADQNYEVHALLRNLNSTKIPRHDNIIPFKGNICAYDTVQKAVKHCDYVFHTAAFTDLKYHKIDKFYNTNVVGTKNVLEASLRENVKKVVYTSTLSTFGPALYKTPITEEQPRLESYANDYELTKSMSEEVVAEYVEKGVFCTILSPTRVYGPGLKTYSNGVNAIISKILHDKVLFVPSKLDVEANYVFIDDVVNAELLALKNGKAGEKYIIGGENSDYKTLFSYIKNISKSKISIFQINYDLVKNCIAFINNVNAAFGKSFLLTPQVLDSLFTNRSASSQKAVSTLNYRITPLKTGLKQTINYLSK
ncbi:NAD-dependent epimerase/dehydratase family protein [Aestuariivivens sediminicola]|uniref:NAD-dependent epimerase/dehydratase family protein n=1 Tax=Aestuariivivens sediminicola TaxID=2913560 RepID=UPI001F582384|nr:NAD-dependent epimerase/dehydratase family protein [Aestuariivivens sediminicola]